MSDLNSVLTRVALANDKQLGSLLRRSLVEVIQATEDPTTRPKAMEILGHVNKRVKPNPAIQLPTSELVHLFTAADPTALNLVQNLLLIYIKMAFEREDAASCAANLAPMLSSIASRPETLQISIMRLLAMGLTADPPVKLPELNSAEQQFVLRWATELLLYSNPAAGTPRVCAAT